MGPYPNESLDCYFKRGFVYIYSFKLLSDTNSSIFKRDYDLQRLRKRYCMQLNLKTKKSAILELYLLISSD